MSRMYIDAITLLNNRPTPPDSLDVKGIEGFRCCLRMYNAQIENQIANRDTDVVKVVRCTHCKYCKQDDYWRHELYCSKMSDEDHTHWVPVGFYCGYGEELEDD